MVQMVNAAGSGNPDILRPMLKRFLSISPACCVNNPVIASTIITHLKKTKLTVS